MPAAAVCSATDLKTEPATEGRHGHYPVATLDHHRVPVKRINQKTSTDPVSARVEAWDRSQRGGQSALSHHKDKMAQRPGGQSMLQKTQRATCLARVASPSTRAATELREAAPAAARPPFGAPSRRPSSCSPPWEGPG